MRSMASTSTKQAFLTSWVLQKETWPVQNAAYSIPNSKQFIAKLKPDLSGFIYSTVFGNGSAKPNISPVAFLVDRCENVYISGWGGWLVPNPNNANMDGMGNMPITPDAIKTTTDNRDFYFIVIKKDATGLLYGSILDKTGGFGEHVDGGTSRYDEQGVIYQAVCANCAQDRDYPITKRFPTTPVYGPLPMAAGIVTWQLLRYRSTLPV